MGKKKINFVLSRKTYDKVRKMDHNDMTKWAQSVYDKGYTVGKAEPREVDMTKVWNALLGVKGIGMAKGEAIIEAIKPFLLGEE